MFQATVDAFLKSDLSVEDFLDKYLELRKLAHLRRIKAEKLTSIIQGKGNTAVTPEKPQRLRKPPPPPVPNPSNSTPYSYGNFTPYPNANPVNQNIPVMPVRQAPQPPMQPNPVPQMYPYPNSNYPSPFAYCSPYSVPQPSKYTSNKKG